jgi:hypothetical protein
MDHIKNQRQVVHASVRRERMESDEAEMIMDMRGGRVMSDCEMRLSL